MSRRRKRSRNPRNNHSGLGAFVGSLVGGIPGHVLTYYRPSLGAILTAVGWIGGGALGGYYGAKDDRKRRATVGGALGGLFSPLGAALGGYIAGLEPDKRQRNPMPVVVPAIVAGTMGTGALAASMYSKHKQQRALEAA